MVDRRSRGRLPPVNGARPVDAREATADDSRHMSGQAWQVLVIRMWLDAGSLRVRILVQGDERGSFVTAGVTDTVRLLRRLLEEFENGGETRQSTDG
jgi:hypothetical protein